MPPFSAFFEHQESEESPRKGGDGYHAELPRRRARRIGFATQSRGPVSFAGARRAADLLDKQEANYPPSDN